MSSEIEASGQSDQVTPLERLRTRLTTWSAFALILLFLTVTIAVWGYAAWWVLMKLIGSIA